MFNSSLLFELSVMRNYALPILQQVPINTPEYAEADRLIKFLNYFEPLDEKDIPSTSLLREFLGGSSFHY
jgi:uridine kinase